MDNPKNSSPKDQAIAAAVGDIEKQEHPDLLAEIRGKLLARAGIGGATAPVAQGEERRPAVRKVA